MIVLLIASIIVAVIVRFALVVVAALVTLCQMLSKWAEHIAFVTDPPFLPEADDSGRQCIHCL